MKKSLPLIVLTLFFISLGFGSFAQPSVDIGPTSGATHYYYGPYYRSSSASSFDYSNYAYLYTASELGIPAGAQIIEVAWLKASGTLTGNNTFNIWMENNNATSISSTTWSNLTSTATSVYTSSTHSFDAANNSYESVSLDAPFHYTGGSLTIIAEHEKNGTASAANEFYYETENGKAIGYASSTKATASTSIGSSTYSDRRPTIRITYKMSGVNDAGVTELTSPVNFCAGTETIKVKINNSGINIIDSVKVGWTLDGVAQTPVNVATPLDTFGGIGSSNLEVTLGTHTFTSAPVDLVAWTYLPNGVADTSNMNDTLSVTMRASLIGTYTINSAQATGGSNYQSFADFTDDLIEYGVCGPVVANVSGGPFNEFIEFSEIAGASATNTIRINGNGATVQYNNDATDRQLLILDGAKYVTIDSLEFKALSSTYGWAALITNGAAYDSVINCFFDLTAVTSISSANSNGIAFSGSNTSPTTLGNNGSHCYIGNNHLKGPDGTGGAYYGIALAGDCDSNVIENNIIENFYYYGLRINGTTGLKVLNNEFHKTNKTASFSTSYGLYASGTTPGLELVGNRVHHPGGVSGYSGTFYGVYALSNGTATDPVLVANNAIYGINYSGIIRGIYTSSPQYNLFYHNTIDIDQNLSGSSANYGIYIAGTGLGTEVKNNNVSITGGSTGTKYGFYYASASSLDDAQKNNFYVNSTQSGTQYYGYLSSAYTTKAAFQSANPTLEVGSPDADPLYVNAAIGDLNVQSPELIANGEDLSAWVPEDIDGNSRPGSPTIGAFEKPPAGLNNAGTASFVTPSGTFCSGQQSVSVTIYNGGVNNITSAQVHWTVDGVAQPTVNYTGTLVPLTATSGQNDDTVVLGNVTFQAGTPAVIKAWTAMPNGVVDTANLNDTIQQSFQTSLSGTFTINSAQPTGGTNYQSFTDFTTDLSALGVCGPVIANVSGGPFSEVVTFEDIPGASATNTIRVNGNGAIVQFNNTSTDRQMLTLSGAKYVTIDDLTFKTQATTYGWGALITNNAAYDSIINCTFDLSSVTSTSSANNSGIVFSATETSAISVGANGSHMYIGNNHVKGADGLGGPYYGLAIAGDCDSNVFVDNLIENFYYYGLRINGGAGNHFINNEFHRANKTASFTTFYGMYATGETPGLQIVGNRIHHPGGASGYSGTFNGMYALSKGTTANPVLIANNAFYGLNYGGLNRGLYISNAHYNQIYHNTIVFDKVTTSTSAIYGIYATGTNTGTEVMNNIVSITEGTAGSKYGFYYTTTTSMDDAQKNNFYVNSNQSGTEYYGYFAANYTTKAAFQAAHPLLEVGSPDTDPMFFNAALGDFNVQSPGLIGNGIDLTAIVPEDINGNTRLTPPTIGAFEQAPSGSNNAGSYAFISPVGTYCAGPQSVSMSIANAGVNDITSVQIHWSVDGVAQPVVNYTDTLVPLTATSGQNMDTITLGNASIPSGTPVVIKAWTSLPNGVPDTDNSNDTISLDFEAAEFLVTAGSDTICSGDDVVLSLMPDDGYQTGDITWQSSSNGTSWTDLTNSDTVKYEVSNLTSDTWFRVKVGATNSCYSDTVKVTIADVDLVSTTPGERCGSGTVTLGATGTPGSSINWYSSASSTTPLDTGNSFTTPNISTTTDYWVAAATGSGEAFVGPASNAAVSSAGGPTASTTYVTFFTVHTTTTINSVDIYASTTGGSSGIEIVDLSNNSVVGTYPYTVTIANGQTIPINETLPPGDYSMGMTSGSVSLYRNTSGANFPYTSPQLSITGTGFSNAAYYYYFYNWSIGSGCEGARQMVTATVKAAPTVDLGNDTTLCDGDNLVLDAQNAGNSFVWSDNSTSQTLTVNTAGTYFVTVTGSNNCSQSDTIEITAGVSPISVLADTINLCAGDTLSLDAGNAGSTFIWDNAATTQVRDVDEDGLYTVSIESPDGCILVDSTEVVERALPVVELGNDTAICDGTSLTLDAGNAGSEYLWSSGDTTQTITVTDPELYTVSVTSEYNCIGTDEIDVSTLALPTVDAFNSTDLSNEEAGKVKFSAVNPQNVTDYDWDFGDGSPHSDDEEPTHTYIANGLYTVVLTVSNECGEDSISLNINIETVGIASLDAAEMNFSLYPNPGKNEVTIANGNDAVQMEKITIVNVLGATVYEINTHAAKEQKINVSGLASGIYSAQILTDKGLVIKKFEVIK